MSKAGQLRISLSFDGKLLGPPAQAGVLASMLAAGTLKRLRILFVPRIVGGAGTPTLIGPGVRSLLEKSVLLRLEKLRCRGRRYEAEYSVRTAGVFASAVPAKAVKDLPCKRAIRKTTSFSG